MMASFRGFIATKPLLAHVFFGSSLNVGWTVFQQYATFVAIDEDLKQARADGNADLIHALEDEREGFNAASLVDVGVAGLVGGLQGAAMRFYYPWLEAAVDRRFASAALAIATKVLIDHAPAALSTVGLHTAAKISYQREYHLPADPDSLTEVAMGIAERLEGAIYEARDKAARILESGGSELSASKAAEKTLAGTGPTVADTEQIELIDTILSSQPTYANYVAFAITCLNFTVVPRWLRGVVGTAQWQLWDRLDEALHGEASPVAVHATVDLEKADDGGIDLVIREDVQVHRPQGYSVKKVRGGAGSEPGIHDDGGVGSDSDSGAGSHAHGGEDDPQHSGAADQKSGRATDNSRSRRDGKGRKEELR